MKRIICGFALCCVLVFAGCVRADSWWWSDDTPYVTSADAPERAAEDIIRDVWGAENDWARLEKSLQTGRVVSVRIIPQADKTSALDMRVRIDSPNTYAMTIINCLQSVCKLIPKLLLSEKLSGIDEFRLYGSLPMSHGGNITEDIITKLFMKRELAQNISWDKANAVDLCKYLLKINDGKNCTYWVHGVILSGVEWLK